MHHAVGEPRPPIFGVGGHNGDVFCYLSMAGHLPDDQPLYGLQPPGLDGVSPPLTRVEAFAEYFAAQIRDFHPSGPCVVAGFCAGGTLAFELGRQLLRERPGVAIMLFAAPHPSTYTRLSILADAVRRHSQRVREWGRRQASALAPLSGRARLAYAADRVSRRWTQHPAPPDRATALRTQVEHATLEAIRRYTARRFDGHLFVLLPSSADLRGPQRFVSWRKHATRSELHVGPDGCTRDDMLREPHAPYFAAVVAACTASTTRAGSQPGHGVAPGSHAHGSGLHL
jgi:thioesterase domain-containing protein